MTLRTFLGLVFCKLPESADGVDVFDPLYAVTIQRLALQTAFQVILVHRVPHPLVWSGVAM